ncbi:hypothetical protein BpHYR1_045839 [Brachionus plicatilis]|uniref:Uncharacterized protein n=1 Tax=Brachionus plicatilis TaxID=10195 RepID=A0A3M7RQV7_BRAPC|nr:hypothetical protein BpHYR1_045839 [Brachionus plicatilis]
MKKLVLKTTILTKIVNLNDVILIILYIKETESFSSIPANDKKKVKLEKLQMLRKNLIINFACTKTKLKNGTNQDSDKTFHKYELKT